jgi:hypothetical protein
MKKFLSGLTVVGLLASLVLPQAQAATDEQWEKTGPPTSEPSWGIAMNEDTGAQAPYAELISVKSEKCSLLRLVKVIRVKSAHGTSTRDTQLHLAFAPQILRVIVLKK